MSAPPPRPTRAMRCSSSTTTAPRCAASDRPPKSRPSTASAGPASPTSAAPAARSPPSPASATSSAASAPPPGPSTSSTSARSRTGFVNDASRELVRRESNWGAAGLADDEALALEALRLRLLALAPTVRIGRVETVKRGEPGPLVSWDAPRVSGEAQALGLPPGRYLRLPVTDHTRPSDAAVDRFVRYVRDLPAGAHVHLHCRGGKGRTATFIAMLDMLRNAARLPLPALLARQALLNDYALTKPADPASAKAPLIAARLAFLKRFHASARQLRRRAPWPGRRGSRRTPAAPGKRRSIHDSGSVGAGACGGTAHEAVAESARGDRRTENEAHAGRTLPNIPTHAPFLSTPRPPRARCDRLLRRRLRQRRQDHGRHRRHRRRLVLQHERVELHRDRLLVLQHERSSASGTTSSSSGTSASSSSSSSSSTGSSSSGTGATEFPFPHAVYGGGAVLSAPNVITVTFAGNGFASDLASFGASIASSSYWTSLTSDLTCGGTSACIGPGPTGSAAVSPVAIGSSYADLVGPGGPGNTLQPFLQSVIQALPSSQQPAANDLYVFYIPTSTTITLEGEQGCASFGGYHNTMMVGGTEVVYAVVLDCGTREQLSEEQAITFAASHENPRGVERRRRRRLRPGDRVRPRRDPPEFVPVAHAPAQRARRPLRRLPRPGGGHHHRERLQRAAHVVRRQRRDRHDGPLRPVERRGVLQRLPDRERGHRRRREEHHLRGRRPRARQRADLDPRRRGRHRLRAAGPVPRVLDRRRQQRERRRRGRRELRRPLPGHGRHAEGPGDRAGLVWLGPRPRRLLRRARPSGGDPGALLALHGAHVGGGGVVRDHDDGEPPAARRRAARPAGAPPRAPEGAARALPRIRSCPCFARVRWNPGRQPGDRSTARERGDHGVRPCCGLRVLSGRPGFCPLLRHQDGSPTGSSRRARRCP